MSNDITSHNTTSNDKYERIGSCSMCGECCRASNTLQPYLPLAGGCVGNKMLTKNNIIDNILYCDFIKKDKDSPFVCLFIINNKLDDISLIINDKLDKLGATQEQYEWFLSECPNFPDANEIGHCPPLFDILKICPNCNFRITKTNG